MNLPDDWGSYYYNCYSCGGSYHASEGGCDNESCYEEEGERSWLSNSGYEFDGTFWHKLLTSVKRQARKDHKDGKVKTGQYYYETKRRCICDETGNSHLVITKKVIHPTRRLIKGVSIC
jgi:hypothetical protein